MTLAVARCDLDEPTRQFVEVSTRLRRLEVDLQVDPFLRQLQRRQAAQLGHDAWLGGRQPAFDRLRCPLASAPGLVRLQRVEVAAHGRSLSAPNSKRSPVLLAHWILRHLPFGVAAEAEREGFRTGRCFPCSTGVLIVQRQ
jgi:hypothetical protein